MAERLKIQRIVFRAGSAPGQAPLDIATPNVTVLVGPNNSGKSLTLRELEQWCQGFNPQFSVIDQVEVALPDTHDELRSMLSVHEAEPPPNQLAQAGHFWVARPVVRHGEQALHQQVGEADLSQWFQNMNLEPLRQVFVRLFTLRLDGRTRFDLVEQKGAGPLEGNAQNHLWALFVDDEGREKVRQFTEEAFGKHFVIDPTGMTHFRVRLSDRAPQSKAEEQALDATARAFHADAPLVSTLGDGLRTSIGLVSAVMSLSQRILLIDEPEAFLHPTLARRVGRVLASTARERDASLVVATHSADFLMGCIQATPNLRLVRLTYSNNQPTARSIEPLEIVTLMNDPLLRSTNALRALFHRGVIIAEADADRAFYEEINYRLVGSGRGVEDGLFLNAQNWQTIPRITTPLRRLGIPAAAVFDFDVLMDAAFHLVWPLLHTDAGTLQTLQNERVAVAQLMNAAGRQACKASGLGAFQGADQQRIQAFIARMAEFGLFFVPVGELECWLQNLGVQRTNDKPAWLTNVFTRLGADPSAQGYIVPGNDDVWDFVSSIERWVADPQRLGIPA
ncbi:AAA family ATPase [Mesorhizobium sp. Z1-4]|uniref:ATP-dependent nuclease n=1 Tax=Mesorhizobium sp. Z1-4 TaxID=2448478 RepID=UPI000FD94BB1|nr:AAA family ATPase [Mesorhizobium sp. Z1-4]